jgi:alginate O-acetyltransferase complex protein AlgI
VLNYSFAFNLNRVALLSANDAPHVRMIMAAVFSLIFYGWWRPDLLPLLIFIACWLWSTGLLISRAAGAERRSGLLAGIVPPLCSLIYFKYTNLLIDSAASIGAPLKDWSPIPRRQACHFLCLVQSRIQWTLRRAVPAETNLISCSTIRQCSGISWRGPSSATNPSHRD